MARQSIFRSGNFYRFLILIGILFPVFSQANTNSQTDNFNLSYDKSKVSQKPANPLAFHEQRLQRKWWIDGGIRIVGEYVLLAGTWRADDVD